MRKEQTKQKKKTYERRHAHCRLFAALDDAAEPIDAIHSSPDPEPACNEPARSEPAAADVSADEYFIVAKNVIEAQEELFREGGEVEFQSVLYARKALSFAAKIYAGNGYAQAERDCDAWIARAKALLQSPVQESAPSDSIILPPRPPARGR